MQAILKAFSWTLMHSIWQGLVLAIIAAIVLALTRKSQPATRYNLLGTLLLLFVIAAVYTFSIEYRNAVNSFAADQDHAIAIAIAAQQPNEIAGESFNTRCIEWFDNNYSYFMLVWSLFFVVQITRLVRGLFAVRTLRRNDLTSLSEEWMEKFKQLKHAVGVRQSIQLMQSALVKIPVAIGFFKPLILLPVGLINHLPSSQIETILLHEIAHIRRRDYLINFLQHITEAFFFFNPAIRWISSLLRDEREACCDEVVMSHTGSSVEYLHALVAFQEYALPNTHLVMAASHRKSYLLNRVKRMLTKESQPLNRVERLSLLVGFILVSAFTTLKYAPVENIGEAAAGMTLRVDTFKLPAATKLQPQNNTYKPRARKIQPIIAPPVDTLPKKKKENALPSDSQWHKAAKAAEIDVKKIKDRIQVSKDSIGRTKEKLMVVAPNDLMTKKALELSLKNDRDEIELHRQELKIKQAQLKEYKDKDREKQQSANSTGEIEKKMEMTHESQQEQKATINDKPLPGLFKSRLEVNDIRSVPSKKYRHVANEVLIKRLEISRESRLKGIEAKKDIRMLRFSKPSDPATKPKPPSPVTIKEPQTPQEPKH
jgi:bla regulator protein BlaR1